MAKPRVDLMEAKTRDKKLSKAAFTASLFIYKNYTFKNNVGYNFLKHRL